MFTSKSAKILKAFNFKTDQEGILNRYFREEGGWMPHLQKTKDYILQSAESKQKDLVVVLGSGWLLDVPVEELSKIFKKVILVDIFHPVQIIHKTKKLGNVEFITCDITGIAEKVFDSIEKFKKSNKSEPISAFFQKNKSEFYLNSINYKPDLVVSVNLLNQLDILVTDYLKKFAIYSEEELVELKKNIQLHHLSMLPKNKTCLITDYKEMIYDKNHTFEQTNPLIFIDLPEGKNTNYWQWDFDLSKTYYKNKKTVFEVIAMEI